MGDASYLEEISSKEAFINRVTNPTMEVNWAKINDVRDLKNEEDAFISDGSLT